MNSSLSVTYLDYSNEKSTVTVDLPLVTAANYAATASLINDLVLAAADIIGGVINKRTLTIPTPASGVTPGDAEAQREEKWLVGYHDSQGTFGAITNPLFNNKYTTEIATAELSSHLQTNSDYADLVEADVAAFVTAFEAVAKSPSGGTVVVDYIKFVGRKG